MKPGKFAANRHGQRLLQPRYSKTGGGGRCAVTDTITVSLSVS